MQLYRGGIFAIADHGDDLPDFCICEPVCSVPALEYEESWVALRSSILASSSVGSVSNASSILR